MVVELRRKELSRRPIDIDDLDFVEWNRQALDAIPVESERLSLIIDKFRIDR